MLVNNNAAAVLLGLSAVAAARKSSCRAARRWKLGAGSASQTCWSRAARRWWRWERRIAPTLATTRRQSRRTLGRCLKSTPATSRWSDLLMRPKSGSWRSWVVSTASRCITTWGSGCLLDTRPFGLSYEPMPQDSIRAGADLVFFSGDKLAGRAAGGKSGWRKGVGGFAGAAPLGTGLQNR